MSKTLPKLIGNYQIGDCIGKGAFGKVFKALNTETGQIVAIKQISISDISKDQLKVIQQEINLMKKLSHKNIVKYIGKNYSDVMTTEKYLNIVLEYIENGSLAGIIKKFNTFQEALVAFFTRQVLQGLKYLHHEGLVHRDIKGANLLTTKDGTVKLADFGVAMKLSESIKSMSIVGTPYWMAPEIVEQSGRCTTSCDIWSVGCTVIELISGRPPYYDMEPMSALYRIVRDDYPPLPTGISPDLKDFLLKCFQKEPLLRKSASELLKHSWILKNSTLRASELEMKENLYSSFTESQSCKSSTSNLPSSSRHSSVSVISFHQSLNQSLNNSSKDLQDDYLSLISDLDKFQTAKVLHLCLQLLTENSSLKKSSKTLIPILRQILEESEEFELLHLTLQLTNSLCSDPDLLVTCASVGLLSSALKYIGEDFCKELRIEAAFLIGSLFSHQDSNFHLFLASGGVEATVKLLDPNFSENKELVVIGVDCLLNLFEAGGNEFLRLCADFGVVERLALALDNTSSDGTCESYAEKVADLLMIFSTGPESVLIKFCEEDVLSIIVAAFPLVNQTAKLQVLNVLQNLAEHKELSFKLENAGFVVDVVKILKNEESLDLILAVCLVLNSLCEDSPPRQEQAVLAGAVPVVLKYLNNSGRLGQICYSLMYSFARASNACRGILNKHKVFDVLLKKDSNSFQGFARASFFMKN